MYVYLHENALWYYLLYIYSQCQAKYIKIKYLYLRKICFVHRLVVQVYLIHSKKKSECFLPFRIDVDVDNNRSRKFLYYYRSNTV